jgi:hypothetical protein
MISADFDNKINEFDQNDKLIYTSFPWLFPTGFFLFI